MQDKLKALSKSQQTFEQSISEFDSSFAQGSKFKFDSKFGEIAKKDLEKSGLNYDLPQFAMEEAAEESAAAGSVARKINNDEIKKLIEQKSAGYGITGRQLPETLEEQIVLKDILRNPFEAFEGKEIKKLFKINDVRWKGWDKYQVLYRTKAGKNITMHFNFNEELNLFDDFKFK